MPDINLFSLANGIAELTSYAVPLERELQTLIEQNMQTFFGVTFLKSEYIITNGRIDSLGIDENNCPVIFEYKRSLNENVINQGLFYLDWLLDHKADFQLLVMEVLGLEKSKEIDWSMPCVMCIASDFTKYDEHAVNQMQRNIKLIKYKKFEENLLMFEHLNAPMIKDNLNNTTSISNGKKDKQHRSFIEQYEQAPEKMKQIYLNIKDYMLSLGDDITENTLKLYVAFRKVRNIVCIEVYQKKIYTHLKLDPNTVELIDGFTEDVRNIGHYGTGDLRIEIKTNEDFERSKHLFERAYNEN